MDKREEGPEPKGYKACAGRRRTRRLWTRVSLWTLFALVVVAGGVLLGSYLWLNAKVTAANDRVPVEVREILRENEASENNEASSPAESMDILLLGSDTREDTRDGSRSDVVMLVHVDRENDYLSMLSLPRDLHVEVEGYGSRKLNYAYAVGGAGLLMKTVQQNLGVYIDHFVEVDFKAFMDITDSLGGVYLEIDRPYTKIDVSPEFDRTTEGTLDPGYQLMDGLHALGYVRFRYDANADFGRMARQQRFISALRQQAMGWNLGLKLPGLVGGFLDNASTDLGTNQLIGLAKWGIGMDSAHIRQVVLRGITKMSGGVTFVFCSEKQIKDAVSELLTPTTGAASAGTTTTLAGSSTTTTSEPSEPAVSSGKIQNAASWVSVAKRVSFAVRAPTYIARDFKVYPRGSKFAYVYDIQVGGGKYPALVMLYRNTKTGGAGKVKLQEEYINITETTWLDAPVASPGHQVTKNGTVFTIVSNAGKVERIWWKSDGVLYWVSNSLSAVASESELLAMARSMTLVPAQ